MMYEVEVVDWLVPEVNGSVLNLLKNKKFKLKNKKTEDRLYWGGKIS